MKKLSIALALGLFFGTIFNSPFSNSRVSTLSFMFPSFSTSTAVEIEDDTRTEGTVVFVEENEVEYSFKLWEIIKGLF